MISVLLATYNGADTIDRTLAAMAELEIPADGWELIIVNNASTDDTPSRILKWRGRLPLKYLVEPRLGKSRAMNTALGNAQGDFIVMTDDDVLPDRAWLTEWRRTADAFPGCSIFGGAIVPEFGAFPPTWSMPRSSLTVLYGQTPDLAEGETAPIDVSGGNMAIRKSVFDQGCRFDENFLIGIDGLMGEDAEFVKRAWGHGFKVGFAPRARLRHIIHKHQMSWRWIFHRFYRHGQTMFTLEEMRAGPGVNRFPIWRIRRAATSLLQLIFAAPRFSKERIFTHTRALAYDLGALRQAWTRLGQKREISNRGD